MKRIKGFTVIELMIAVVILAVLVAVGIPSFRDAIERNAVSTSSNEVLNGLLFARGEAIRTETNTTFTPLPNGWQVTSGGNMIRDQRSTRANISIAGNPVAYNARGRANIANEETVTIRYDNEVKGYVCVSLTGRPYTKSAEDGNCP